MTTCGLILRIMWALLVIGCVRYCNGWRLALVALAGLLVGVPLVVGIVIGVRYLLTWCGCNA